MKYWENILGSVAVNNQWVFGSNFWYKSLDCLQYALAYFALYMVHRYYSNNNKN